MFGWPANIMSYTWIDWRHLKFHLGLIYGSPLGVQKRKSFHLMTMKRINIRLPGVSAQTLAFFPLFFNFFITSSRCWMKSCVRSSSKSSFPGFQKEYGYRIDFQFIDHKQQFDFYRPSEYKTNTPILQNGSALRIWFRVWHGSKQTAAARAKEIL